MFYIAINGNTIFVYFIPQFLIFHQYFKILAFLLKARYKYDDYLWNMPMIYKVYKIL